jgi:hypothetical protein
MALESKAFSREVAKTPSEKNAIEFAASWRLCVTPAFNQTFDNQSNRDEHHALPTYLFLGVTPELGIAEYQS